MDTYVFATTVDGVEHRVSVDAASEAEAAELAKGAFHATLGDVEVTLCSMNAPQGASDAELDRQSDGEAQGEVLGEGETGGENDG